MKPTGWRLLWRLVVQWPGHSSDGGTGRLTLTNVQTAAAVMNGGAPSIEPEDTDAVVIEARVRVSDVDESSIFFGFTDADNDSVIIEDEDGSLNTVATDAFGFLLEGEQDETWQAVGVKNGADNAADFADQGAGSRG